MILQPDRELTPVSLAGTLEAQIAEIRSTFPSASLSVEDSLPPTRVLADEMLPSVFRNLLKNAVQHNDKAVPELTVSATEDGGTATVRIADNGPGIPEDRRDTVFGRGEKGLESEGTGIGLYLVRTLLEGYGGEVWVEENDPEGAVFVVELSVA
ncbi:MAG: sensor histidine kinase [Halobacteriales archaeon]